MIWISRFSGNGRTKKADEILAGSDLQRLEARVKGRVQGVCFRHYTSRRARELNLLGWVRNESDGSVMVAAEGPRIQLESLLEFLQEGPEYARVDKVETRWGAALGDLQPFSVKH